MAGIFLALWNRSLAALWLILAVFLVRLLWRKAPKSVRCLLWLLVGLRLVLPVSVESALSLVPSAQVVPQDALLSNSFQIDSGIHAVNSTVNEYLRSQYDEGVTVPTHHARDALSVCGWVWLAGLAALLLRALALWRRLRCRVAEAVPDGDGVWVCDAIASPFLLGVLRPRIYLPPGLPDEDRAFVTAHENAHLRRRDHWSKPAAYLLLAVYWFSPPVWLAYVLLCRDIELACDERVIRELGPGCKRAYSQAILRCSAPRGTIAACPLAFGEAGVKERVKNVLNYKKPALWVIAASLAVVLIAAVCFLTDPASGTPEGPAPSAPDAAELGNAPGLGTTNTPPVYTGGALLYQSAALSSYFSDSGGVYASVQEDGDTLVIRNSSGAVTRYTLEEQRDYTAAQLYEELPFLSKEEEWMNRRLLPEEVSRIARRTYVSNEPAADGVCARESVWAVSLPDGGKRMWIGDVRRLFALIDLREQFQFFADVAATWTYDPSLPTAIPVRFETQASVWTAEGGLALDLDSQEWTGGPIAVEPGQTVYWQPFPDGQPGESALLQYRYPSSGTDTDSISLRSAMDYEGLYGGRTYAISQDWLGLASSRFHETRLRADSGTGGLAVSRPVSLAPEDSVLPDDQDTVSLSGAQIQNFVTWDAAASG